MKEQFEDIDLEELSLAVEKFIKAFYIWMGSFVEDFIPVIEKIHSILEEFDLLEEED